MPHTRMRGGRLAWLLFALLGTLGALALGAETAPTAAEPKAPIPVAAPSLVGTTVPFAPSVFVGGAQAKPAPPPVRPDFRVGTPSAGTVTFVGRVPKDARISIPPFWAYGKGEIEVSADGVADFSGDGVLWIDVASSVSLDRATTYTKTQQGDGWTFDKFRGTARVTGSPFRLRVKGDGLRVTATGKGKATLSGEMGMYRAIDDSGQLVSGIWKGSPVTQSFAKVEAPSPKGRPDISLSGRPEAGSLELLPAVAPAAKVITPRPLPSSKEGGAMAPAPGGPAPTPSTPAATPAPPAATPAPQATPAAPTPATTPAPPAPTPAGPPPAPPK